MIRKYIVHILILVLIAIALTDLLTGVFYWNRLNLVFDAGNFNNIVTPVIAVISVIVYALALILNFKQTQIIQSQHLKPYYLDEIRKNRLSIENMTFSTDLIETKYEVCNGINYPSVVMEQIKVLINSNDFLSDLESYETGEKYNISYFKERDYYKELMFISQFTFNVELGFKYKELIELGKEINNAKLLNPDMVQLRRTVYKEILLEFISYVDFEKSNKRMIPQIPELYSTEVMKGGFVDFRRISETNFSQYYKELKQTFKE